MAVRHKKRPNWEKIGSQKWVNSKTSYSVTHCGHPTALWPYAITSPVDGRLIIAPNGTAFQYLAEAQAAADLLAEGILRLVDQYGMGRVESPDGCLKYPIITWKLIRKEVEA